MSKPAHHEQLREFGKYFGFPTCCIEDFIQKFNYRTGRSYAQLEADDDANRHKPWYGTGYVPCPEHDKAIQTPLDLAQVLAQQPRECPTPFPSSGPATEIHRRFGLCK